MKATRCGSRPCVRACWLTATALVLLCAGQAAAGERRRAVRSTRAGLSEVGRVLLVVLENTDLASALQQPFLASLAARGALLQNYHAITHPSEPNYIALTAGSTFGIANDDPVTIDVPHIGDLLEARNLTWKLYAENYPGDCFLGVSAGTYVRRHVPFLSYADIQSNAVRCEEHIVNAVSFDADVASPDFPRFAMYIPNLLNDGHDTGVATAAAWLQSRFGNLLDDAQFMNDTLFIVVFDEGSPAGTNTVYCSFTGAGVQAGAVSAKDYDHYDLLRTIEEIFHIGTLGRSDDAAVVINDIWKR